MSNWIFRANPLQFRIHDFIRDYKFVEYLQEKNVQVGDIVYLYITAPAKRVEYKMVVEKTNISSRDAFNDTPYSLIHKATTSKDSDKVVRFKLISERVKNDDLCYKKLCEHGFHYTMQNDRELPDETAAYIDSYFK